ncbi:hypothetical protein O181_034590 [Austropuccinia psidii MF-1]|uniref:Transcription activator of gluconeogenesis ERT1 n=1 Tax=Austropuccinia psidii MF-1 TaxID=1389203 RepID=A0A9Q3HAD0_9BASI|nr:hypothetical protein [Austropuccinia psidii MF-1]
MAAKVSAPVTQTHAFLNPTLLPTNRLLPRILTSGGPISSSSDSSSSSCSSSPATTHVSADSWGGKSEVVDSKPSPRPPRRKKASRACGHCQKAHLTCDDGRPCFRCEKRGLATTCRDGVRKKAKYLSDYDDSLLVRPRPTKAASEEPIEAEEIKKIKEEPDEQDYSFGISWPDLDLLDGLDMFRWSATEGQTLVGGTPGITATNEAWEFERLDDWIERFESVGSLESASAVDNFRLSTARPHQEVSRAGDNGNRIEKWVERVERLIEIRKLTINITADDEWMIKRNLDRSLTELDRVIALSGTPTVVWNILGEILRVGDEFCMLTEWTREELIGRHIEQIFEPHSLNEYLSLIEKELFKNQHEEQAHEYHSIEKSQVTIKKKSSKLNAPKNSLGNSNQAMKLCAIRKSYGQQSIGCSFCFKIREDTFNCPSIVIGNFLPILSRNSYS